MCRQASPFGKVSGARIPSIPEVIHGKTDYRGVIHITPNKVIAVTWAICLAVAFVIVKVLRIGPVILVISEKMGWGVHVGDFLAFIPITLAILISVIFSKM